MQQKISYFTSYGYLSKTNLAYLNVSKTSQNKYENATSHKPF